MTTKRILMIDDSELMLAMTSDVLTEAGYEVMTATNSIEANQYIFAKEKPSLILMDVMMPLLQGDATVQILRKAEFTSDIPIVYVSSKSPAELEKMVSDTGAAGYLLKPFSDDELLTMVRSLIG
jgi:DNA-binding response OmpR family regulator